MDDKKNNLYDKYKKGTNDLDERIDKVERTMTQNIFGVGSGVVDILDISKDYKEFVSKRKNRDDDFNPGSVSVDYLSNIKGKDIEGGDLAENIMSALEDLPRNMSVSPNFEEMAQLELEYNFMCAQMPQLIKSIESKVNNITNPDNISEEVLNVSVELASDSGSKITSEQMRAILEKVEGICWNTIYDTFKSGNTYFLTIPVKEIAAKLDQRLNSKDSNMMYAEEHRSFIKGLDSDTVDIFDDLDGEYEKIAEGSDFKDKGSILLDIRKSIRGKYQFTNNGFIPEHIKSEIGYKIAQISESSNGLNDDIKQFRRKYSGLSGLYFTKLDNSRIVPVVIERELVGVYYIDDTIDQKAVNLSADVSNMTSSRALSDNYSTYQKHFMHEVVIDKISDMIRKNLNTKFIKNNKKVIGAIDNMLRRNDKFMNDGFKIRFIPRKYVTPFSTNIGPDGLGRSVLHRARTPAHIWILLNYNNAMNKLFFEKDKLWIKARMGKVSTDVAAYANKSLRSISRIFPNPNDILNLNKTYGSMSDIGRIITPVDSNDRASFTVERIEGQVEERTYDFKKEIEHIATSLVGTPFTLSEIESGAEFATQILLTNKQEVIDSVLRGKELSPQFAELISKMFKYEFGLDVDVKVELPKPKAMEGSTSASTLADIRTKCELIAEMMFPEDTEKQSTLRAELFKEYTKSLLGWENIEKTIEELNKKNILDDSKKDDMV